MTQSCFHRIYAGLWRLHSQTRARSGNAWVRQVVLIEIRLQQARCGIYT